MVSTASFRWFDGGYAVASATSEGLRLSFANSTIIATPRELVFEKLFMGVREHSGQRREFKTIYVRLAFPLRGLDKPQGVAYQSMAELALGAYGIVYTPLDPASTALTIYPPPGALFEYIVVTPDTVAVTAIQRRRLFQMRENSEVRLILM